MDKVNQSTSAIDWGSLIFHNISSSVTTAVPGTEWLPGFFIQYGC